MQAIEDAISTGSATAIVTAFQQAVDQFPTHSGLWHSFAQQMYLYGLCDRLEQIFAAALRSVADVALWRFYLRYVQGLAYPDAQQARTTVGKAFELAVGHVGLDFDSSPLWTDYVEWARQQPVTSMYEEQQKMDTLRRIYARLLAIPNGRAGDTLAGIRRL